MREPVQRHDPALCTHLRLWAQAEVMAAPRPVTLAHDQLQRQFCVAEVGCGRMAELVRLPGCRTPDQRGLGSMPGVRLPVIKAALANRVIRTRRAALQALSAWPASAVPDQAVRWVCRAAAAEPDQDIRQEMTSFIADHQDG
jgi:hypothetical protein